MDHASGVRLFSTDLSKKELHDQKDGSTPDWLNRRLLDLLMAAPSAIGITVGPEHRWAYVNTARIKMAGRRSAEDFIGKTVRESYPELEGQPFFAALDEAYRTATPFVGNELRANFSRGPNGAPEEAFVDCVYQPILTPDGQVEGLLIHTVEVSEKVFVRREIEKAKEGEQQQRAAAEFERNQLRELFKQAPAAIATLAGPRLVWTFANSQCCEIVGRTSQQLLNRPIRETLPELADQGFFELLDQVYSSGVPYIGKDSKTVINRGPNGSPEEAYFDFIYQPVRNINGQVEGIMTLAVEVTEQFRARTQLELRVKERTTELQQAHASLRMLSACLMQAQDEERRKVARELHDSVGQYLAAIDMSLTRLMNDSVPENFRRPLQESIEAAHRCTVEIRTLSYLLHPPLLDELGLGSAIRWYVQGFSERSGIAVDLDVPEDLPRFSSELETAIFRIIQQGLANVHKHSGCKHAAVHLTIADANLKVEVCDEGRGISPELLSRFRQGGQLPGVGISGMRERVIGLSGSFELHSGHSGTTISLIIPISQENSSAEFKTA